MWVVMSCGLVEIYGRFGGTYSVIHSFIYIPWILTVDIEIVNDKRIHNYTMCTTLNCYKNVNVKANADVGQSRSHCRENLKSFSFSSIHKKDCVVKACSEAK
jgi:hypothetical protein